MFYLCFDLFSVIMVVDHGIYDHDLRKEIKMIVKLLLLLCVIAHKIIKRLSILYVTASETMIKE